MLLSVKKSNKVVRVIVGCTCCCQTIVDHTTFFFCQHWSTINTMTIISCQTCRIGWMIFRNVYNSIIFSRDSDLTSTNVCLAVSLSVHHQYVEIAYKQQSPVTHASQAYQSSMPVIHASHPCQSAMPVIHASHP